MIPYRAMRVGLVVVAWTVLAGCKPARDPRAVERLVPLGQSIPPQGPAGDRHGAPEAGSRSGTPDASAAAVTITDRPAPQGALGVHWGMSRAEVTQANRAAGVTCRDSQEYLFCPRAMVPVPTQVIATYEFCGDLLCAVALDGVRTRDEVRIDADYGAMLGVVQSELGAPAVSARRVAAGCTGHLALCLTSRQAELRARWSWHDGSQGMVSADQDESDAFLAQVSATYLSPERARRGDPAAPAYITTETDAGQTDAGGPAR